MIIGELHLHGRIRHGQLSIIIQLYSFPIEFYENKIIALHIVAQADSDRGYHHGIFSGIFQFEHNRLHDLLSTDCHTFLHNTQLRRQLFRITRHHSATAYYEHSADRFVSV